MTKDEALDLALEALEELQPDDAYPYSLQSKAITAIKQAHSAPVQEPDHGDELTIAYMSGVQRGKELAAQRQWVGLTDEGRKKIYDECQGLDVMKAIIQTEAKLRSKNNG
jgi:hypothetical protein